MNSSIQNITMMNLEICEKESDENVAEKCVSTGMTFYHVVGLLVFIFYVSIRYFGFGSGSLYMTSYIYSRNLLN